MIKTLQFKLRNPLVEFLSKARCEVNFVWNWANATSFNAISRSLPVFLSWFALIKLATPDCQTDPVTGKQLHQSLGFSCINTVVAQAICQEYVVRRIQFKKKKLKWRKSYGSASKRSLGWIPLKQENLSISLQDVNGNYHRLGGKNIDLVKTQFLDFFSLE